MTDPAPKSNKPLKLVVLANEQCCERRLQNVGKHFSTWLAASKGQEKRLASIVENKALRDVEHFGTVVVLVHPPERKGVCPYKSVFTTNLAATAPAHLSRANDFFVTEENEFETEIRLP